MKTVDPMTTRAKPPAPMEPLKPCPFCGDESPIITNWRDKALPCVQCSANCGAALIHNSEARAAEAWNRRAAPALPEGDGEVGELVNRIDGAYLQAVGDGDDALRDLLGDASDALSRQSAELTELRTALARHKGEGS